MTSPDISTGTVHQRLAPHEFISNEKAEEAAELVRRMQAACNNSSLLAAYLAQIESVNTRYSRD